MYEKKKIDFFFDLKKKLILWKNNTTTKNYGYTTNTTIRNSK
jgi:hypothetical protein